MSGLSVQNLDALVRLPAEMGEAEGERKSAGKGNLFFYSSLLFSSLLFSSLLPPAAAADALGLALGASFPLGLGSAAALAAAKAARLTALRALITHHPSLCVQDIKELTPLTPEIISRQATINIGALSTRAEGERENEKKKEKKRTRANPRSPFVSSLSPASLPAVRRPLSLSPRLLSSARAAPCPTLYRCARCRPSHSPALSPFVCPSDAGTIGHVAHGKSTVVKSISGVQTV